MVTEPATTLPAVVSTVAAASPEETRARAAVLTKADLPADFGEQTRAATPDHETTWQELLACLDQDPVAGRAALATAPTFLKGMGTQVTSTVEYKDTDATVAALAATFAGPAFVACAQKAYAADVPRNAPSGLRAGPVVVAPLEAQTLGQSTSAYRATAKVGPVQITTDFVTVFKDRAIVRHVFISPFEPFPPDIRLAAVEKVAGRA